MVPLCTLVIGGRDAVVLSAILNVFAGIILHFMKTSSESRRFWIPLAAGMVAGSVIGGILLKIVPVGSFEILLGLVVLMLGLWFIVGRSRKAETELAHTAPLSSTHTDIGVAIMSGIIGGFLGMGGPLIIFHLGRRFVKETLRSMLITIFIFSSLGRIATYVAADLVNYRILSLAIFSLPAFFAGLLLGNRFSIGISEVWFSRLVGSVLIISSFGILLR